MFSLFLMNFKRFFFFSLSNDKKKRCNSKNKINKFLICVPFQSNKRNEIGQNENLKTFVDAQRALRNNIIEQLVPTQTTIWRKKSKILPQSSQNRELNIERANVQYFYRFLFKYFNLKLNKDFLCLVMTTF